MRWYDYGYLEEIVVRRDDNVLYNFKEDDFPRLNLRDIKDMLLILVQKKLSNLDVDDRYDLGVALRMFTKRIVILYRVEDLQLGVESYQKKLNIIKPETTRSNISKLTPYTAYKTLKESFIKTNTKETFVTSLICLESYKSPTKSLLYVGSSRISIFTNCSSYLSLSSSSLSYRMRLDYQYSIHVDVEPVIDGNGEEFVEHGGGEEDVEHGNARIVPFDTIGVTSLVPDDVLEDVDVKIGSLKEAKDRVYLHSIESRRNLKLYKNERPRMVYKLFYNVGGYNVEASSSLIRQAEHAKPIVGQDGLGGSDVGQVSNVYGLGIGVVIGLSSASGQPVRASVGVGSRSSSLVPSLVDGKREEYKQKDLVHNKNSHST
nr:hypothetical protein [Tanacetum cinerariifolium]